MASSLSLTLRSSLLTLVPALALAQTPSFQSAPDVKVGGAPSSVAMGDIDGDGDQDLVVATELKVSVRLNGGTGSFSDSQEVSVYGGAGNVALGDVDGDGDLDLVTSNTTGTNMYNSSVAVSVRLNGGDATGSHTGIFSGGQDIPFKGLSAANKIVLGDVDGDHDLDALTLTGRGILTVLLNGGDATGSHTGTFSQGPSVDISETSYDITLGDVDGNGTLDAVFANRHFTVATVYLNDGKGAFRFSSSVSTGRFPTSVALGDIDRDGDLDLVTGNYNVNYDNNREPHSLSVRLNNGKGSFSSSSKDLLQGANIPFDVAFGDLDRDGDLDLVSYNLELSTKRYSMTLRLNNGAGQFSAGSQVALGVASATLTSSEAVALRDIDGDRDLDLVAIGSASSAVSLRLNGGTGPRAATQALQTSASVAPEVASTAKAQLLTYPNPTHGVVHVQVVGAAPAPVQVFDTFGVLVRSQPAAAGAETVLSLAGLRAGVYTLRMGTLTQRLVLQ